VGGGVAGLTCAARLAQININDVVVFDTGKQTVGGRCSSRQVNIGGQLCTFDHAVQYFTATDSRFKKIVSYLVRDGAAKHWKGPVGHLNNGHFQPDPSFTEAYIGTNGVRSICESLAKFCQVQRPVWISTISFDSHLRKWTVDKYGVFDYVVIAHNGKCAAKLTEHSGAPEINKLCQTRFASRANLKDNRMTLSSMFVLIVAFESSLKLNFEGAHVSDANISWVANNSAKYGDSRMAGNSPECWTIISTTSLAEQNKVPQEHIPPHVEKQISKLLLEAFCNAAGLKRKLPSVCFQKLQLWGAAVPINTLSGDQECVFDGQRQIGICSDWLTSPCVQGAAVSGLALAESIGRHAQGDTTSTNLHPRFKVERLDSPIGAFP